MRSPYQKIQRVPLDEQLGLPQSDFSYLLQDWSQRLCLGESFAEAAESLRMLLGLSLGVRALEQINHGVPASVHDLPPVVKSMDVLSEDKIKNR